VADPQFGEPPDGAVISSKRRTEPSRKETATQSSDLSNIYFPPLRATSIEARAIKTQFPEASLMTGAQATESFLKQTAAPRILHIATHGFFLAETADASQTEPDRRSINVAAKIENPLLRSGLAFAGANLEKSGDDDGVLTALEASSLNLWGTQLVTLSACDTGVGEIKTGEGVFGLRRAFLLSGAETLLMSLWPVSDQVTRELMTQYYTVLKQGVGRSDALRHVQLKMLKRPDRRHPFYWASFIQSGQWSPLRGEN
jgi:CHAT domain-containing protein